MIDNRRLGVCIPTFCRVDKTIESFEQVINDDRIESVVIIDDCSPDDSFEKLRIYFEGNEKVKVYRNGQNMDCYFNKRATAFMSKSEWIVIFDSDNIMGTDYLDALFSIPEWDKHTLYQPQFSRPHFDFRKFAGVTLTKENVNEYMHTNLETAMNAFNCFVNRAEYLRVWDGSVNPITSDSIFFNYTWLKAGNKFHITEGLEYDHYISPNNDGHYQTFSHLSKDFHKNLLKKFKELA